MRTGRSAARSIPKLATKSASITVKMSTTSAAQTQQFITNLLIGLSQHINECRGVSSVLSRQERVGRAGIAVARRTTDSVHVVLGLLRVVDVYHVLDIFDI